MKNNGKIWKILEIIAIVFLAFVGAVYGYGMINGQYNSRLKAVENEIKKAEDTRERLIRLEEGVEYLKKAVDRIEKKL